MWWNYLTVGIRALARNRAYAAISIAGLALGIAGCLTILNYVRYESSYDAWLPDSGRVYQVQTIRREPGQPVSRSQNSPFPVGQTLAAAFPQIDALTVLQAGPAPVVRGGVPVFVESAYVDPSFFAIFRLAFAHGDPKTALADTRGIVLTESEAIKQFGVADVIGRTVAIGAGPGKQDYRVAAVLRDLPKNSSLRFGLLFRRDPAMFDGMPASETGWAAMGQQHYVRLRAGADAAAINAALPAWEKRTIAPQPIEGKMVAAADMMDLKLVQMTDVHLGDAQQGALTPGGDTRTLATFAIIALLTLGMAVMNFVNLSTARATVRAREVALRKTLGASRGQIVTQFFIESLLATLAATLIGLAIAEVVTPWVAAWTGADLTFSYSGEAGMLVPSVLLILVTAFAGGLYPAIFLSRFHPATALRAGRTSLETASGGRLRTSLVALQFAIAIGLITCTWVIFSQTRYVERLDPGYRRDGLIQIDAAWRFAGDSTEYETAKRELLAVPGVVASGRTNLALVATNHNVVTVRGKGATQGISVGAYAVDADFFATMEVPLLAGRGFSERFARDRVLRSEDGTAEEQARLRARGLNVVVNRSAARALGFNDPGKSIGKEVRLSSEEDGARPATIVGVVEDTRLRTPRDELEPIIYSFDPARTSQVMIRYAAARPGEVMAGIERVWRRFEPEIPFQGSFAETILAKVYAADRARGALFAGFSFLAIVIACLGLYSLAAFSTERRTREIGIRKVVGARVRDIVRLLVWQFSKPVVLANLVAWPVAWWAMRDWLNTFDARIALGPGPFALAGILAFAIAVATVAGQSIRAARMHPAEALRYE